MKFCDSDEAGSTAPASFLPPRSWWRCLEIAERLPGLIGPAGTEAAAGSGQRRFDEWQSQPYFRSGDVFSRRLAQSSCTPEALAYILAEPLEALCSRVAAPGWLIEVASTFASDSEDFILPTVEFADATAAFMIPFLPLIRKGCRDFAMEAASRFYERKDLPFDTGELVRLCYPQLYKRILLLVGRTMTLELNVVRVKGLLTGASAEERFEAFSEILRQGWTQEKLLAEYPVLLRLVATGVRQWKESNLEFFSRLAADWPSIVERLGQVEAGSTLCSLKAGLGDPHCGGRSVLLATFDSGLRLIYKPRSLAVDERFQALLEWMNDLLGECPFKRIHVLDRGTYGWMEYVERRPCSDAGELRRFYERQGQYLALLYALGATDVHHENLIAHGEHPVLIDLETLFHPLVRVPGENSGRIDSEMVVFSRSVLGTGLLPQPIVNHSGGGAADSSGLGAADGRLSPFPELTWENIGTDRMQVVKKHIRLPEGKNRPKLEGGAVRLSEQVEPILAGFLRVYRKLEGRRQEFKAQVAALFAEVQIRSVLRPTRAYATLFRATLHPDSLRDALDRSLLLDRLWIGVIKAPCLEDVIRYESRDLERGDIPYFTTTTSSKDLTASSGEALEDFFEKSGLEVFYERVDSLSADDLERQAWLIRSALLGPEMLEADHFGRNSPLWLGDASARSSEWFLELAREIGERVCALGYETPEHMVWMGLKYRAQAGHFLVEPVDFSLYGGHAGISIFLGYLGLLTGEPGFERQARKSVRSMVDILESTPRAIESCGAFEGGCGVIYALAHLGSIWRSEDLLEKAVGLGEQFEAFLQLDEGGACSDDIIGGLAGCVGALASVQSLRPTDAIGRALEVCGRRLVSRAVQMPVGVGWRNPLAGDPLPGFAHGNAGIAWSLMRLYNLTGIEGFRQTALGAVGYENTLFDARSGNWLPSLAHPSQEAEEDERSTLGVAWCHGAPGVALGRIPFSCETTTKDLSAAVETTLRYGFGANHSLCHGALGNLDCLLEVAQATNNASLLENVLRLGSEIGLEAKKQGWRCGVPRHMETPGLMVGIAGIGYGLLRLARPDLVPSVLALAPPTGRGSSIS